MMRVLSLNDPLKSFSSEQLCDHIAPLQREGIDLLCCQSIAHNLTSRDGAALMTAVSSRGTGADLQLFRRR